MRSAKWVIYAVAVGLMAATAGWLNDFEGHHLLGPPGVKVGAVPIYNEQTNLVSRNSVLLPTNVPGVTVWPQWMSPITIGEVDALPKDTTFGRRFYRLADSDLTIQLSVVLMGTDHTSIHQPQYCLYARDWNITNTERINIRMDRPYAYDIPAIKLTATHSMGESGKEIECLYVYWFVSGNKITAEEGSRLWSMWKTMLQKGEMERWAYVSYFAPCQPGREQATFERLEKFIRASAPEFQLVTGHPSGPASPLSAQK